MSTIHCPLNHHPRRFAWLTVTLAILLLQVPVAFAHPLLDRVWDVRAGRLVSADSVLARAAGTGIVLLGEAHGNPVHHALQLRMLEHLEVQARHPALVFEIFDRADQMVIDRLRAEGVRDADRYADAVGMDSRGWDWPQYRPLVQFALDRGWPIVAGNLSRDDARRIAAGGIAGFEGGKLAARIKGRLDTPARERLETRILESHCGHLPRSHLGAMADVQQARDAYMAGRLKDNGASVLIAGAGHARLDYGVPRYLDGHDRQAVLSIAFTEVRDDAPEVAAYLDEAGTAHDYLWFTARHSPEDPCAHFAEELERMRERISR